MDLLSMRSLLFELNFRYFHYAYFPELLKNKDKIAAQILEYWESVKHLIPHESYVVDFAIMPAGGIKIIEINPFVRNSYDLLLTFQHYSTGAPFFHWKTGSEGRKRLLCGPFDFRVREDYPPEELRDNYMV